MAKIRKAIAPPRIPATFPAVTAPPEPIPIKPRAVLPTLNAARGTERIIVKSVSTGELLRIPVIIFPIPKEESLIRSNPPSAPRAPNGVVPCNLLGFKLGISIPGIPANISNSKNIRIYIMSIINPEIAKENVTRSKIIIAFGILF